MFTRYDKAGAGVLGSGLGAVKGHFIGLDEAATAALVTVLTSVFVFLVPNKEARPS